jgi:hypothetical protein
MLYIPVDGCVFLIASLRCAGLVSTALVLSIALPFGGQNWYWISALSPLAGVYYWQKGTRQEDFKVTHFPL